MLVFRKVVFSHQACFEIFSGGFSMEFDFYNSPKSCEKVDDCPNLLYNPLLRLREPDASTRVADSSDWYQNPLPCYESIRILAEIYNNLFSF